MKKGSLKKVEKVKKAEEIYVSVDYPAENEVINPGHYAVRTSASEGYTPEISVDGYPWVECRFAGGFWWFDLNDITSGTHIIEARIRKGKKLLKKVFRSCECR